MKLLATDYDGIVKTSLKNLNLNIEAINKFREKGNKFAIITGRSFESIKKEIMDYEIEYDYLSCNNGLIVFDNKDNIINSVELSNYDSNFIYNVFRNCYGVNSIDLYNNYTSTNELKNILEILISFNNINLAKYHKKCIENTIPNIRGYRVNNNIYISKNYTKSDAVKFIQQLEKLDLKDIYAVGDNSNDLEMLNDFNGYKMLVSYPNLWLKPLPITRQVHTLVKKINK